MASGDNAIKSYNTSNNAGAFLVVADVVDCDKYDNILSLSLSGIHVPKYLYYWDISLANVQNLYKTNPNLFSNLCL